MTQESFQLFFSQGWVGVLILFLPFAVFPFLVSYLLAFLLRSVLGKYTGIFRFVFFLASSCWMLWQFLLRGMYQACMKCTVDTWPSPDQVQALRMGHLVTWVDMMTVFYLIILFAEMQGQKHRGHENNEKR